MKIGNKIKKSGVFRDRLKAVMDMRGMTQADLARASGLNKGGISNYITGRYEPKQNIVQILALTLNCSEAWLMGYDVPMGRPQPQYGYEENPRESELCDYYATFAPEDQEEILQYVKARANLLTPNSPGERELSEGEKMLLELFRKVPKDRQELVLGMIKAAIENLSK